MNLETMTAWQEVSGTVFVLTVFYFIAIIRQGIQNRKKRMNLKERKTDGYSDFPAIR